MMEQAIEPRSGMGHAAVGSADKLPPRRQYTLEFKRRLVEETFAPGASVSIVARRHDINSNLVFTWRRRYREGTLGGSIPAPRVAALPAQELVRVGVVDADGGLRPLRVSSKSSTPLATPHSKDVPPNHDCASGASVIEFELPNRVKVRVDRDIAESALRRMLAVAGALP